jgi:hypothetical protein
LRGRVFIRELVTDILGPDGFETSTEPRAACFREFRPEPAAKLLDWLVVLQGPNGG